VYDILGPSRSPTPSLQASYTERTSSRFTPDIPQARARSTSRLKPATSADIDLAVAPPILTSAHLGPPSDLAPALPPQDSPSTSPRLLPTTAPEPLSDMPPLAPLEEPLTAPRSPVNTLLMTQPPLPTDPTVSTAAAVRPTSPPVAFPRSLTEPFAKSAFPDPPNLWIKSRSTPSTPPIASTLITVEPRPMQRAPQPTTSQRNPEFNEHLQSGFRPDLKPYPMEAKSHTEHGDYLPGSADFLRALRSHTASAVSASFQETLSHRSFHSGAIPNVNGYLLDTSPPGKPPNYRWFPAVLIPPSLQFPDFRWHHVRTPEHTEYLLFPYTTDGALEAASFALPRPTPLRKKPAASSKTSVTSSKAPSSRQAVPAGRQTHESDNANTLSSEDSEASSPTPEKTSAQILANDIEDIRQHTIDHPPRR
jgi:hypothetical protein